MPIPNFMKIGKSTTKWINTDQYIFEQRSKSSLDSTDFDSNQLTPARLSYSLKADAYANFGDDNGERPERNPNFLVVVLNYKTYTMVLQDQDSHRVPLPQTYSIEDAYEKTPQTKPR